MPSLNHTPNLSETQAGVTKTYTYDASDRLIRITSTANGTETEIARYAYDPMGRRIAKTIEGQTTYFLYADEGLIAELNEQGKLTKAYGWVADTSYSTSPLWQAEPQAGEATITDLKQAQFHTLTTDHLGTVQMATNEAGEVTWKAQSEAFGKTMLDEKNQITMNLRFPGQYFDEETGTHYNYFRDYNPSIGRYIQRDPIGLNGGMNVYGYVDSRPVILVDLRGLAPDGTCPDDTCPIEYTNKNPDVEGNVLCMNGVKVKPCVWHKNIDEKLKRENKTRTPEADKIIRHCVWEHENNHLNDPLSTCEGVNDGGVAKVIRKGGLYKNKQISECSAYVAEQACLLKGANSAECQKDEVCVGQVNSTRNFVENQLNNLWCSLGPFMDAVNKDDKLDHKGK